MDCLGASTSKWRVYKHQEGLRHPTAKATRKRNHTTEPEPPEPSERREEPKALSVEVEEDFDMNPQLGDTSPHERDGDTAQASNTQMSSSSTMSLIDGVSREFHL